MTPAVSHAAVAEALATLGIAYDTVGCDPSLADSAAFCDAYGFDPEDCANCIVVASRRRPGNT